MLSSVVYRFNKTLATADYDVRHCFCALAARVGSATLALKITSTGMVNELLKSRSTAPPRMLQASQAVLRSLKKAIIETGSPPPNALSFIWKAPFLVIWLSAWVTWWSYCPDISVVCTGSSRRQRWTNCFRGWVSLGFRRPIRPRRSFKLVRTDCYHLWRPFASSCRTIHYLFVTSIDSRPGIWDVYWRLFALLGLLSRHILTALGA